jgi:hypothetical protein
MTPMLAQHGVLILILKWTFPLSSKPIYSVISITTYMTIDHTRREQALDELRTLTPDKAFYFYRGIGQPLGTTSRSFGEFAATVKGIDPSSVRFHVERGDFEGWFSMLGDKSLADQVGALRGKNITPDELRGKVSSIVRTRVDELQEIASSK